MAPQIRVQQTNPLAGYLAHADEFDAAIARVVASGRYILDREVGAFEEEFAAYLGVRRAVAVANGTDALTFALRSLGIGRGDIVATVSHTAVATVAAIEMAGATPLLLDIEADGYCLDPDELEGALAIHPPGSDASIRAVIPVHLYGGAADMARIESVARRSEVMIVEDCSQAHGARLRGQCLGTFGHVAAYSFYPTKNLGALGDGGVVATDDERLADHVAAGRQYGWGETRVSAFPGANSRLDEIQAAILRVKLRYLEADNRRRREIAAAYEVGLAGLGLALPKRPAEGEHVFHQYVVRVSNREGVQERLKKDGVASSVHYPVPVHLHPAYRGRFATGPRGLANTEQAALTVLSLPMYAQLSDDDVAEVCAALRRALVQSHVG
jgi:dTDP-4-amino-4,6-dideoxygalactose transaminase